MNENADEIESGTHGARYTETYSLHADIFKEELEKSPENDFLRLARAMALFDMSRYAESATLASTVGQRLEQSSKDLSLVTEDKARRELVAASQSIKASFEARQSSGICSPEERQMFGHWIREVDRFTAFFETGTWTYP